MSVSLLLRVVLGGLAGAVAGAIILASRRRAPARHIETLVVLLVVLATTIVFWDGLWAPKEP